jgi:hypothetical protein
MKLKITLTEVYADSNPSVPQLSVVEGQVLDIPGDVSLKMAGRIVELNGGTISDVSVVKPESQEESVPKTETDSESGDGTESSDETESGSDDAAPGSGVDVESKEKPLRRRVRKEKG